MGKFVKGQIANPNGRPKAYTLGEIRDISRKAAPKMVGILISIAEDEEQSAVARASAANHVLDRAYGKPAQMLADEEGNALSWVEVINAARDRSRYIEAESLRLPN